MRRSARPDIDDLMRRNKPRDLIEALDHRDPEIRATAATGLADLGEMRALEPLAHHVESDPDPKTREAAATALQRLLNELEEQGYQGDYAHWRGLAESQRKFLSRLGWLGSGGRL